MPNQIRTAEEATKLFDELALETMYGFNMKCELVTLDEEKFNVIRDFIEQCKDARSPERIQERYQVATG